MTPSEPSKTIIIPVNRKEDYLNYVDNKTLFRNEIERLYDSFPEIFPSQFEEGFRLYGFCKESKKIPEIPVRRIQLKATKEVYQVSPSFIMPYRVGYTDDCSKALFFRFWGVPYWALAHVFGRDAMYWYRIYTSLGQNSIVGTTVKSPECLPNHNLFDEKHFKFYGKKTYAATTVGGGCMLGVEPSDTADEEGLTRAYEVYASECRQLNPEYEPETGNTDGWAATQKAIKALFPNITLILCFLHKWLSVARTIKKKSEEYWEVGKRVWHVYRAANWQVFAQRLRRLREWSEKSITSEKTRKKLLKLCKKKEEYRGGYEYEQAHRTSNSLDRLMDHQDRMMYSTRGWHGTRESMRLALRAMALLWNFHPFAPRKRKEGEQPLSAFEKLNGFRYHDNWLQNLLIASSLQRDNSINRKR